MALGAQGSAVLGMILGLGARLAGMGIGIGLLGAAALSRVMRGLLYGVSPTDPLTYGLLAAALALVALGACLVPARRAVRVDPSVALRAE
jgi:putative ABC transport system permease protein